MNLRKVTARALALGAVAMSLAAPVLAQGPATLATVRIAERVGDLAYAPVHLATALGYFKDAGIDAKFLQFDTGGLATKAVVSGGADLCTTTYGGMVLADVQGAGLV